MNMQRIIPAIFYSYTLFCFILTTRSRWIIFISLFKLRKSSKTIKIRLNTGEIFYIRDLYDLLALKEVFAEETYKDIFTDIPQGTTLIDIGGYIGDVEVYSKKFPNITHVIVVEPIPEHIEAIKRHCRENNVKSVEIIHGAAAQKKGEINFYIHPNKGQSGFKKQKDEVRKIKVKLVLFSEIMKKVTTKYVVLKCDCEGAEYELFMESTDKELKRFHKIVFEYHMDTERLNILLNRLHKAGFSTDIIPHSVEPNLGNVYAHK
jgi:FkbM family methyltransferase